MSAPVRLMRTRQGFLQIDPLPSPEALQDYYRSQYYGNIERSSPYAFEYTEDELYLKALPASETIAVIGTVPRRVYEVGVGEGFTLAAFASAGSDVAGVDFTDDGLRRYNPHLLPRVAIRDLFDELSLVLDSGERYDLVIANHVLEHVRDPLGLLEAMHGIVEDQGTCRIMVPNDDSVVQAITVQLGLAAAQFWMAAPDHLSYFSAESLRAVLGETGWDLHDLLADFPIDLYLLNEHSSYQLDPSKGRAAHFARVALEHTLAIRSLSELIEFRRSCAAVGIGRNLVAYAQRRTDPRDLDTVSGA